MRRISTSTRVIDKFGAGKDGFTNGDAVSRLPSTDLEDVWFDHVQEETAAVIETSGAALNPALRNQLYTAIQALVGKGRLRNVQVFTSSGTYTPTPGTNSVIVEVRATEVGLGGAQSAGNSAVSVSGSAGSYAKAPFTSGFSGGAVTIGAQGPGGPAGANAGSTGGTTSCGSLISCPGGIGGGAGGGSSGSQVIPGAASPSAPTITGAAQIIASLAGAAGCYGVGFASDAGAAAGYGGNSPLGAGGIGGGSPVQGKAGSGYGAGATYVAVSTAATAGAASALGVVIVYEYA